jgi:hypothetical protein
MRVAQPVGRQLVKVRGFDFAAVAAEIGVAHVVGHHDDDVGVGGNSGDQAGHEGQQDEQG